LAIADSVNLTTSPQPIHIHNVPAIFYAFFTSGTIWYNLTVEVGTYQLKLAATLVVIVEDILEEDIFLNFLLLVGDWSNCKILCSGFRCSG
jgi:hypothetical protein